MSKRDSTSMHSGGTARRYSTTEILTPLVHPLQPARSASYRPHESTSHVGSHKHRKSSVGGTRRQSKIFDDTSVVRGYDSVPLIEIDALPRGGISLETKAVGRIQVRRWNFLLFLEYGLIDVGQSFRLGGSNIFGVFLFLFRGSLEFLPRLSKIVCSLVWKSPVSTSCQWNDSAQKWDLRWESI
jgi:hypothetical protein